MRSIRQRLVLWLLVWLAVLWIVAGASIFLAVRGEMIATFDSDLARDATSVRMLIRPGASTSRIGASFLEGNEFFRQDPDLFYMVWRAGRPNVMMRSVSLAGGELPHPDDLTPVPRYFDFELADGTEVRAVAVRALVPRARNNQPPQVGQIDLVVGRNRAELDRTLFLTLAGISLVGLIGAIVTGLIVHFVLGRGLQPLHELGRKAASIDASSLQTRFDTAGLPPELLPICDRLNHLLERLERGFERERQFSSDLAHELRTPVAELKALSEVAIRWPARASSADYRTIQAISDRMQRVLETLLLLVRWEQGGASIETREVQLAAAVEQCWQPLARQVADKDLDVEFAIPPEKSLATHDGMLGVIISNLLTNAVEYTPEHGSIRVAAGVENGLVLSVSNSTEGLEPEMVPQLFERFWRRDSAGSGAAHCGLGLPLARSAAEALSLDLSASMRDEGVLRLELRKRD